MSPACRYVKSKALGGVLAVSFVAAVSRPAPAFELTSPPNDTGRTGVGSGPLFDWTDSLAAVFYHLECTRETNQDGEPVWAPLVIDVTVATSRYQAPLGTLARNTVYFWRVTAHYAGGSTVMGTPNPSAFETGRRWKLSRNFYEFPYVNGFSTNSAPPPFHGASVDFFHEVPEPPELTPIAMLAAVGAGVVIAAEDANNGCGCHNAFVNCCRNYVRIRHINGEVSGYLHIKQGSLQPGIAVGECVDAGQPIAIEGDVGKTCGGSGRDPDKGNCLVQLPPAGEFDYPTCSEHLHFSVYQAAHCPDLDVLVVSPIFACDQTLDGAVQADSSYNPADCGPLPCPILQTMSGIDGGYGTFRMYQASDSIVADDYSVRNEAAVVLHAGRSIRVTPGFQASSLEYCYFRAEIGECGLTAPTPGGSESPCSVPGDHPCPPVSGEGNPACVAN